MLSEKQLVSRVQVGETPLWKTDEDTCKALMAVLEVLVPIMTPMKRRSKTRVKTPFDTYQDWPLAKGKVRIDRDAFDTINTWLNEMGALTRSRLMYIGKTEVTMVDGGCFYLETRTDHLGFILLSVLYNEADKTKGPKIVLNIGRKINAAA